MHCAGSRATCHHHYGVDESYGERTVAPTRTGHKAILLRVARRVPRHQGQEQDKICRKLRLVGLHPGYSSTGLSPCAQRRVLVGGLWAATGTCTRGRTLGGRPKTVSKKKKYIELPINRTRGRYVMTTNVGSYMATNAWPRRRMCG